MRISIILILFATTQCVYNIKLLTTPRIEERVRLLKELIRSSLRNPSRSEPDPMPAYEVSDENAPIQPILEENALKKGDKYSLSQITESTPKSILRTIKPRKAKAVATKKVHSTHTMRTTHANVSRISPMRSMMQLTSHSFNFHIFYRKSFLNTPSKSLHCSELVTPYIKGVKKEMDKQKLFQIDYYPVTRFIQLLSTNMTALTREERKSVMYQISILNVRLFSWSSDAIAVLLDLIVSAGGSTSRPTFLNLHAGLHAMLKSWTLDLSNTTTLLLQSRLFRPPCFQRTSGGSSKFVRGTTVPSVPQLQHRARDEDL